MQGIQVEKTEVVKKKSIELLKSVCHCLALASIKIIYAENIA